MNRKPSYDWCVKTYGTGMEREDAMQAYNLRLPARLARMARRVGDGNFSEGARIMMENFVAHSPMCKKP